MSAGCVGGDLWATRVLVLVCTLLVCSCMPGKCLVEPRRDDPMVDGIDLTCSEDDPCVVVASSVRCSCFNGENLAVPKSKERAVEQRRPESSGCDDAESDSPSCQADGAECVSGTCFLVVNDINGEEHSPIDDSQCVSPR